ncbi:cytotoxic and regulatory T-cell molecule [Falco naumanni]|uniref:cytotoxic and regulatory T-cell molecule n=1 Tax=Falco naumanni TaxID=148594 RepID=UPI001ADE0DA6|nr:cytotoxic and regulatory T-cell molecule [Falco naumanni]
MTFTRVLHVAALFLMQGGFPGAGSETITLKEGEDLNLRCTLNGDDSSARQWLNPHGFAIFLNTQQALRDQRYKLIHFSKDELSIRLSNVTVHDEGVYKCFYYGIPFKSKNKTVEVLAAPSNPVLEVSRDTERNITLSCYTHGCKPQPQITWLLDNGIELPGDSKHKLEADGKKWTTTSTLTVLAYGPNSTASCIVRHKALTEERLMASFQFEDIPKTVTKPNPATAVLEVDTRVSEKEQPTGFEQPAVPSDLPEDPVVTSSAPTPTQQNLQPDVTSTWSETAFSGDVTEEALSRTEAPLPSENVTVISIITFEKDLKSEGIKKKENNLLLPILVAALIFVLLIIVLLFMRKLKKAHGVWKRENDVSEQTLESYKSRSNEDSPGNEKNGQVVNQKSNMQYVTEGYVETTWKNQKDNTAIHEKPFGCGKETDI